VAQAREYPAVNARSRARLAPALLGLFLTFSAHAALDRVDMPAHEGAFTNEAVVRGVRASAAQCASLPNAVWAQPEGASGECLRYWHAGLKEGANHRVLFFFSGDLLVQDTVVDISYAATTPARMQAIMDTVPQRFGVPYIFIGRPGTYGSSGAHKERRRAPEARLVSAAIDEIKRRHGIQEISIAGLSGGGHVVASLLGYRSDVVCAVPTSAVSSPSLRMKLRGWTVDATGYSDSYEPMDHLDKARLNPELRVFVLGDPADTNVPWAVQTALADKLRAQGVAVEVLQAEAVGPERHVIVSSALLIGALCTLNHTTEQIRERAAKGLKG
jgi:dienelactone hydrolase